MHTAIYTTSYWLSRVAYALFAAVLLSVGSSTWIMTMDECFFAAYCAFAAIERYLRGLIPIG